MAFVEPNYTQFHRNVCRYDTKFHTAVGGGGGVEGGGRGAAQTRRKIKNVRVTQDKKFYNRNHRNKQETERI